MATEDCKMAVLDKNDNYTLCGKPAPTHGVTMHFNGSEERKPICDKHYDMLKEEPMWNKQP